MNLKLVLPWLCTAAALAGVGGLYWSNSRLNTELAQTQAENQELAQFKAAAETNVPAAGVTEELVRLRKENEDLLRLRNEARQLRQEKQQLAAQLASAQGQAQNAQAQAQAAQARVWTPQPGPTVVPGGQIVAKPNPGAVTATLTPEQVAMNACINNLRQIDGAKQQWALENKKPDNTLVGAVNITPYLQGNALPVCPAGGSYTINAVGAVPTCSLPGHQLVK